jgi:hypothetical protein
VGFADLWGEVDWVCMCGGVEGLRVSGGCQQEGKNQGQGFYAAFYGSSPLPGLFILIQNHSLLMQI